MIGIDLDLVVDEFSAVVRVAGDEGRYKPHKGIICREAERKST